MTNFPLTWKKGKLVNLTGLPFRPPTRVGEKAMKVEYDRWCCGARRQTSQLQLQHHGNLCIMLIHVSSQLGIMAMRIIYKWHHKLEESADNASGGQNPQQLLYGSPISATFLIHELSQSVFIQNLLLSCAICKIHYDTILSFSKSTNAS